MRIEFQEDILRFLVQVKDGKQFIPIIEPAIFDFHEYQIAFEVLSQYYAKYKTVPSKAGLLQFFSTQSKQVKITKELLNGIDKAIRVAYQPFEGDAEQIKDNLIEHTQYKLTKQMMTKYSPLLKDGMEVFKKMEREMVRITRMKEEFTAKHGLPKGGFVLRNHDIEKEKIADAYPTYLKGLNKLTGSGGFSAPEFIIFMGGPKAFKTGVVLNIACEYMRDGLNVYYVDMENGKKAIRRRIKQQIAKLTLEELRSGEYDELLSEMVKKYQAMSGDMIVEYYPPKRTTINDIDEELTRLEEEENWVPHVIVIDYPDLISPVDSSIKEKRFQIQAVYHDIGALLNKRNLLGIGISPVNRDAVNKSVIDHTNFGEDYAKAYNAHGTFAICATPEEAKAGIRRLVPVLQREGVSLNSGKVCVVRVDEARMQMEEVGWAEALKITEAAEAGIEISKQPRYIKNKKPALPEKPSIKGDLTDE